GTAPAEPPPRPRSLPADQVRADEGLARWGKEWLPAAVVRSKPRLARRVINQRVDHVKRFFAWAVSEELVPAAVHDALLRVAGLRRGHEGARETPKVCLMCSRVKHALAWRKYR